nr:prostaglandin E synthase [Bos grunniens]
MMSRQRSAHSRSSRTLLNGHVCDCIATDLVHWAVHLMNSNSQLMYSRLLPTPRTLRDMEASSIAGTTQMWNAASGKYPWHLARSQPALSDPLLNMGRLEDTQGPRSSAF